MMKYLPLLLIVLAVVGAYWFFLGPEEAPSADYDLGLGEEADSAGAERDLPLGSEGLKTTRRPKPAPRTSTPYVDPRTLPRGDVIVKMLGPDLEPLPSNSLKVFVLSAGRGGRPRKLGLYDEPTRTWRFKQILAGKVRVHVYGDHVVDTWQPGVVRAGRENEITVHMELAGAIQYEVILYDKTRPKQVELTLFDYEEKPTTAWFQNRSIRSLSTPVQASKIKLGPEGVVYGLAPGHYRLRAVSENEEWDDAEVDVEAGKTHIVKFEIRR